MAFGMGAYGGGGGAPVMPQHPGGPAMPGAFSYGANPFYGYGTGNRLGAATMGAIGAAPTAGLTGLELFSMTKAGAGVAPFVNPMSAFGAARAAGMGAAGASVVGGLAMLPALAVQHIASNVVQGAGQQSMVNTALGQYNFLNPASRTGAGFTREDASAISSQMRQLAMMPELMTSMQELTKMLPTLKASGVMQGVRDAHEFNRRFKESITTIRDISKLIGSTMEEAGAFFQHSARVGFFGRTDQLRNAVQAQVVTGTTGMTQEQFMQLQQSAAGLGSAMGIGRRTMAQAAGNISTTLGLAQQGGLLRQGLLEDITGKVGPEAVADASMQMATLGMRLASSGLGRYEMLGAMTMGPDGRPHIDSGVVRRMSRTELQQRGRKVAQNHQAVIAFEANQGRLGAEFTGAGGVQATYGFMEELVGKYGSQAPQLLMQRYGATEQQAELAQQIYQAGTGGEGDMQNVVASLRMRQASMKEKADPRAIFRRISTVIGNKISQPFQQFGSDLWTNITKGVDRFLDDLVGNYVVYASKEAQDKYIKAVSSGDKKAFAEIFESKIPSGPQGSALGALGRMASFTAAGTLISSFTGTTAGQDFGKLLEMTGLAGIGENYSGRSVEAQFSENAKLLGLKGLDINKPEDRDVLGKGVKGLLSGNLQGPMTADMTKVTDLVAATHDRLMQDDTYKNAFPEKKMQLLRKELQQLQTWRDEGGKSTTEFMGLYSAFEAFGKGGVDQYTAAIAASKSKLRGLGKEDIENALTQGAKSYLNVEAIQHNLDKAEDTLSSHFGADTAEAIKRKPAIRDALLFINGADASLKEELSRALHAGQWREVNALSKGSINLSPDDVEEARKAWIKIESKEGGASVADITGYKDAVNSKDAGAFIMAYRDSGLEAANAGSAIEKTSPAYAKNMTALSDAYKDVADYLQKGRPENVSKEVWEAGYWKKMDDIQKTTDESVKILMDPKLGDAERSDLLSKSSTTVQAAYAKQRGAHDALRGLSGKKTAYQLHELLHIDEDSITKKFGSSTITLDAENKRTLEGMASGEGRKRAEAGSAAEVRQKTKDDQMITTLKAIAEAVISANADKINAGKIEGHAGELLKQVRAGSATPGE